MGGAVVAWVVLVATLSSLNATTLTGSRIFFAMAVDKNFFSWARKVDPKFHTPSTAIALQALIAVPLVLSWKFQELATYYVFVSLVFYAITTAAVFCLRNKKNISQATYKAWGYPWVPIVFIAVSLGMLLNTFLTSPHQAWIGSGVILSGVPIYTIWQRYRG
jgi:APA family basic amino acid/polyamine antiporter